MRKVTILKLYYRHYEFDDFGTFANAISNAEFQEISDEEFEYLKKSFIQYK